MSTATVARGNVTAAGAPPVTYDLADRVEQHMLANCPATDCGDWVVARDYRDGTAVVVWRLGRMGFTQPGVRGMMLLRWMQSLRSDGYTAEPRTDMEVFGRPEEESPDGIAHWLHITAWTPPEDRPVPETCPGCHKGIVSHYVRLDPAVTPPVPSLLTGGTVRPEMVTFHYHPDGHVGFDIATEAAGQTLPPPNVPGWLAVTAEEHRAHASERSWCYLDQDDDPDPD